MWKGGHLVEELLDCRYNRVKKAWEILVKWFGLQEIENSWEPCASLLEDVPLLVRAFASTKHKVSGNVSKMAISHSLLSSPIDK